MTTCAIMQPTYLPWLGYFDLIKQSDVFVILDSVQFYSSWQQRNRIRNKDGWQWLTVPVKTERKFYQKISEVEVVLESPFARKHISALSQNYKNSDELDSICSIIENSPRKLCDLNELLIRQLAEYLGCSSQFYRSSEMGVTGTRIGFLVNTCKALGADRYLSPVGAKEYIDEDNIFADHGIELVYQDFEHPVYQQRYEPFISHLSAVDYIFTR